MAIIEIKNLNFKYNSLIDFSLKNINLSILEGSFNLLIGRSGSGKTTLLKHLKKELCPHGQRSGEVFIDGKSLFSLSLEESGASVGFVFQDIEEQIVTDKVFSELAFGLENLKKNSEYIERSIAEMASFFGLNDKIDKDIYKLSGGEKQLVNLAAVMLMRPKILVLDEPTAQLDPITAKEFLSFLKRINREFGTTIVICEHRTEDVFPLADNIILMDDGKIDAISHPKKLFLNSFKKNDLAKYDILFPTIVRLFKDLDYNFDLPLSISEGIIALKETEKIEIADLVKDNKILIKNNESAVSLKDIHFRYEKNSNDVMKGASLNIDEGEFVCLLGCNGSGKTTALSIVAGLNKPYLGNVKIFNRRVNAYKNGQLYDGILSALPQNPSNIFLGETVEADLMMVEQDLSKIKSLASELGIDKVLKSHPYDLSGGEMQKAALAKVLLTNPRILILDEPTKGLDAEYKQFLGEYLQKLNRKGVTIICATHDVEFAASYSSSCCLFFNGKILKKQTPHDFFNDNYFYTTTANRLARAVGLSCITLNELKDRIKSKADGKGS